MQKKKGRLMRVEGGDRIESVRGGVRERKMHEMEKGEERSEYDR